MALLLDTGIIYALADADDAWHVRARDLIAGRRDVLIVPAPVIPEAAYLIRSRLGAAAELAFARSLAAGELAVQDLTPADWQRSAAILVRYPALGLVDASVVAIGERLKLVEIATTDRRHFRALRPAHRPRFELLP